MNDTDHEAEIERLRDRLHDEASLAEDRKLEIERLNQLLAIAKDDVERLRSALREIVEDDIDWWVTARAREALGEDE